MNDVQKQNKNIFSIFYDFQYVKMLPGSHYHSVCGIEKSQGLYILFDRHPLLRSPGLVNPPLLSIDVANFHLRVIQQQRQRNITTRIYPRGKQKSKMPKRKRKNEDGPKKEVKFKGVIKIGERFRARITIDDTLQYLGTFDTAKKAARAYDRAAMQAGRPPTTLNYQDKVPMNYKTKKKKLDPRNTIGYRGVSKKGNRFYAQIQIGGRVRSLGLFGTTKEAAIAYDLAAIQAKRQKSDLNFPDMIHVKKEIPKIKKRKLYDHRNKTGFNGVSKKGKKFVAMIRIDGKQKYLGIFTRARDAAMVYDEAIVELSGKSMDELKLNFPDGMSGRRSCVKCE